MTTHRLSTRARATGQRRSGRHQSSASWARFMDGGNKQEQKVVMNGRLNPGLLVPDPSHQPQGPRLSTAFQLKLWRKYFNLGMLHWLTHGDRRSGVYARRRCLEPWISGTKSPIAAQYEVCSSTMRFAPQIWTPEAGSTGCLVYQNPCHGIHAAKGHMHGSICVVFCAMARGPLYYTMPESLSSNQW